MISKKIADKLQDREYRTAFVASQINIGIPFQIKALMKARGWTQEQLAERTGMLQPRISAMLKPGKVRPNIETLRRYAEAFDCGLLVRFAPYSELARWSEEFDPERFTVPSFSEDTGFIERKGPQLEGGSAGELAGARAAATGTYQELGETGTSCFGIDNIPGGLGPVLARTGLQRQEGQVRGT